MARKYAINGIAGLKGGVETHQNGELIRPGDYLQHGVETFDVTYWYSPTEVDIREGATPGVRLSVTLYNVPTSASGNAIKNEIMQLRAQRRATEQFGYQDVFGAFGDEEE